jgi:hypothetical protein
MRKTLILMLSAVTLTIASCKKSTTEEEQVQPPAKNCQLIQSDYKSSNDAATYSYTYNINGKIATAKDNFATETYTYSATDVKISRSGSSTKTYNLDNHDRATTIFDGSNINNALTYNSDGYLIQKQILQGSLILQTEKYFYTNGNLTSVENGNKKITIEYGTETAKGNFYMNEVDTDIPLILLSPIKAYLGKLSANLPTKTTNGNVTQSFSYTKDDNGNIIKVTVTTR